MPCTTLVILKYNPTKTVDKHWWEMGTEYIEHCITWITGVNQNKFGRKRRHMRFNLSRYYSLVILRRRLKICN